MGASVGKGVGTATARGNGAVGRTAGLGSELVDVVLAAFGVFSGSVSSVFALAVFFFFFGVASFFAIDFFLVDFDFGEGVGDFFGFGVADSSGVSFGFGVVSSSPDFFFFDVFAIGPGDFFGWGDTDASGVSLLFADDF